MIRIKGKNAVSEASLLMKSPSHYLEEIQFYVRKDGQEHRIFPELIPALLESGAIKPEWLFCEVPSVWDLLSSKGETSKISFFKDNSLVVILDSFEIGDETYNSKVSAFAVPKSVFVRTMRWARSMPAMNVEDAVNSFLGRIFPRIFLRRGGWVTNMDLFHHCEQLAKILAKIYSIDLQALSGENDGKNILSKAGWSDLDSGPFFDRVMDAICKKFYERGEIPPSFCLA